MNNWAVDYLGKPWVSGATGPEAFDCWGFVRHVKRVHFNEEVPVLNVNALSLREVLTAFRSHPEYDRHELVQGEPKPGDIVVMRHTREPAHCGVWLDCDGGGVLHCARSSGVVFQRLDSLKRTGWSGVQFYRLKDEYK